MDTPNGLIRGANIRRTVCEVLRELWDLSEQKEVDVLEVQEKLKEAYLMVKKMDKRLRFYADRSHYHYENNDDYETDVKTRAIR